tara:strand:- start:3120 stop:3434 length:315 start_codon:yes stop_codon:yes gene_type:complete
MVRFGTKQKPIEAFVLSDGINLASSAGQHFVNITLVGYVHHKSVNRRIENFVEGDSELHYPEIGPKMASSPGQRPNQGVSNFDRELFKLLVVENLNVVRTLEPR